MNERYRYGYGDEPGERDSTFSRQRSMTDPRADVDEDGRGDEEDEDRRADRIRQASSETRDEAPGTEARDEQAADERASDARTADARTGVPSPRSTSSSSVFDVEDEASARAPEAHPAPAPAGEPDWASTEPAAAARTPEPTSGTEARPPIALGPPSRTTDEAAGTAKPEAATPATGTSMTQTPAAVSTGVEAPESDRADQRPAGTETEMLVPGSGPAPVAAPDERSALLGAIDADAIRARFLDIQAGFVDEPRQAVQEAERFVDGLVQDLVKALENERSKMKGAIEQGSTEDLRLALRGYRAFVDRLLNLSM